jgi:hypothetical protein
MAKGEEEIDRRAKEMEEMERVSKEMERKAEEEKRKLAKEKRQVEADLAEQKDQLDQLIAEHEHIMKEQAKRSSHTTTTGPEYSDGVGASDTIERIKNRERILRKERKTLLDKLLLEKYHKVWPPVLVDTSRVSAEGTRLYTTFIALGLHETRYETTDEVAGALSEQIALSKASEESHLLSLGTIRFRETQINEELRTRQKINPRAVSGSHEYTAFLTGSCNMDESIRALKALAKRKEGARTKHLRKLFNTMDVKGKGVLTTRSIFQAFQQRSTQFQQRNNQIDANLLHAPMGNYIPSVLNELFKPSTYKSTFREMAKVKTVGVQTEGTTPTKVVVHFKQFRHWALAKWSPAIRLQ